MNFNDPDTITGGFSSTDIDRHLSMYAAQTDRLVNSLSAAIAQISTKTPAEAAARAMDPGFRLGVAAGARVLGGYNPADLMRGVAGAVGSSMPAFNMTIAGPSGGTAGATYASGNVLSRGSLTDVFAKNVFDHIQSTYFNQLGLSKMSKTFGMTRGQMGDVFNVMGQRGMLAGMVGGDITENQKTGTFDVKTSTTTFSKIDEQFRKTAQVLGVVKKMFGASGSIAELANLAEQATGITLGPNSIGAVLNRLQNINSFASAANMSVNTAATIIGASAQSVSKFGPSMSGALATGAAQVSGTAFRGLQAAAGFAASRGDYIAPKDIQELQQTETVMRGRLLEENPLLAESLFVLQNVKTLTPEQSAKIQKSISAFQNAGTGAQQQSAAAAMRAAIESATGTQAGVLTEKMGGLTNMVRNLSPENQQRLSNLAGQNLFNRGINELTDLAATTNMAATMFGPDNKFSNEDLGQAGMAVLGGLSARSRDELVGLLKSGNKEKALALLQDKSGLLNEAGLGTGAGVLRKMITQNNLGTNQFIRQMEAMGSSMEYMKTTTSIEDLKAQQHINARKSVSTIFDTALINQPGTIEQVIRNTLGQTNIGNEEKMRYLAASGKGYMQFDMSKFGGTAAEAKNLQEVLSSYDVNLFEKFNVKQDDYAGLSQAISQDKDKIYSILADKGVVGAQMPEGKVGLAYKSAADEAAKRLEVAQQAKTELVLEGVDSSSTNFEAKLTQRMAALGVSNKGGYDPESEMRKQSKLTEKFSKVYSQDAVLKDTLMNPDSQRFKDLQALQKSNPDLLDPMFKAAKDRVQNSDENKTAKERKLQQLNDIQERLKEAKGNNMVGIVELRGDKTMLKLMRK